MTDQPVAVELGLGEALIRQSSGRHRAQFALGVGVSARLHGPWGIALEGVGTTSGEHSDEIALRQYMVRPAILGALHIERGRSAFEAGIGPCVSFTLAHWGEPTFPDVWVAEPGGRARMALALGVGEHVGIRLHGGLAWRASGVDHDYQVGATWRF